MSLRERYPDEDPIYLILDVYPVHKEEKIKLLACELKIELIYIPPGLTDEYQPLDRRVFGVMKQVLRKLWREAYIYDSSLKFTKKKAMEFLIPAWERISPVVLEKSWEIYQ